MFYDEEGSALVNCFAFLMGQFYVRVQSVLKMQLCSLRIQGLVPFRQEC